MSKNTAPRRVQRRRTKGWRMPENSVYVGRGTKWGNPWKVGHCFSLTSGDPAKLDPNLRAPIEEYMGGPITPETAVELYRLILPWRTAAASAAVRGLPFVSEVEALAGKNLVCWCPLDQPCHADVLLEFANDGATSASRAAANHANHANHADHEDTQP